jgi:hypothetical protein
MFDRKAYGQKYSREKRERRKAEGLCVTCGVKLTFECTTLQCEHCREKQKYQNVAKVNISKLIAEAKADTVRKMHTQIKERCIKGGIYPAFVARTIDQIAKEMLEGAK